jgi:hypothetical protein
MEDNAREFPNKTYETMHALEDGSFVAVLTTFGDLSSRFTFFFVLR